MHAVGRIRHDADTHLSRILSLSLSHSISLSLSLSPIFSVMPVVSLSLPLFLGLGWYVAIAETHAVRRVGHDAPELPGWRARDHVVNVRNAQLCRFES